MLRPVCRPARRFRGSVRVPRGRASLFGHSSGADAAGKGVAIGNGVLGSDHGLSANLDDFEPPFRNRFVGGDRAHPGPGAEFSPQAEKSA
jgi:hypothetical protein